MLFNKYLFKYYLKYAFFFIVGALTLIAIDYVQLLIGEYIGQIVDLFEDAALNGTDIAKDVLNIFWKVMLVAAIIFAGRMIWRYTIFYASHKIESKIREDMFLKAEKLSIDYFQEAKVGNIMNWFTNDLETVEEYLGWGTVQMVDAIFLSVFTVVKMIILSWQLTVIVSIPMLLIAVWGFLVEKFVSEKWELRQKSYDEIYDFTRENFTGIRVIKAFVKENQQILAFSKIARKNQKVNIAFGRLSVLVDVIIELIIGAITCLIFGFGGWFIFEFNNGTPVTIFGTEMILTVGKLSQFFVYYDTLIWPMIALGQVISMHSRARTSLKRIRAFLDSEEDIKDVENPIVLENISGEIEFKNLSFTYKNAKEPSLKNINIKINGGETIGVIGKIGSGKSTLVNLLMRLYNIEDNSILIDGKDIMKCSIDSVRRSVAYVPQDNFLFSASLMDNIKFADGNMSDEEAIDAAKFADVYNDIVEFKDKFDTQIGERGVTLSGGQKQRVSIARAYAKKAPILILDDSVSAVDIKTEEIIINNLKELRKNQTTIIIASRISTVMHLDRILVLKDGEVEAFDNHANLLNSSETYKRFVALQELEGEIQEGGN